MTLFQPIENIEDQEFDDVGSYNHSMVQANMAYVLKRLGKYSVFSELSLDASSIDTDKLGVAKELKPDACIYPKRRLSLPLDILRMTEMPLLVVEIVSPRQGLFGIMQKFVAYFALGVRSCWLIDPVQGTVSVYTSPTTFELFKDGDVKDTVLEIVVPISDIFEG